MTWGLKVLSEEQKQQFDREGFLVIKDIFRRELVEEIKRYFMDLQAKGEPVPGYFHPVGEAEAGGDILRMYPRVMHPHRFSAMAFRYLIHPTVMDILEDLFGEEALAAQSMFYYKPPGAKGQALHQDNFYLKVEPGTCIAAWTAIDAADEENGGLFLVPESQLGDIQCPHPSDPAVSFTREEVNVPEGLRPVPVALQPGDVLFFNGSVIHGSYPNTSADRFRRAFICHYAGASTSKAGKYYKPMFTREGAPVAIEDNTDAGPCGTEYTTAGPH
ncbi:phytanoyl-CoA dioxygenase family protein [Paenibacillus filicis]|uniref:Phytanoyl-CoA dioxygenase family protein n=1 Tax=Paenibacillus gyeongsangnamensis TaxID=3388067 RepID=A0ABT4QGB3_9BACL|nr:phytanoyl-CoA dioxygenase family protein [Paenibacillus filicis]MCZ8515725.1 phytanoyl-CoA dioxygenase family protein [Paenibacillus filicis]